MKNIYTRMQYLQVEGAAIYETTPYSMRPRVSSTSS